MASRIHIIAAVIASAALGAAGCSSSSSLSQGDQKLCVEAAKRDSTALASDRPLADNKDIKRQAERIGPDSRNSTNEDAMNSIVGICTKAGWKNVVAEASASASASEEAAASASQRAYDNRAPKPAVQATLPAPTCKENNDSGSPLADYTDSLFGLEGTGSTDSAEGTNNLGKVASYRYLARLDDGENVIPSLYPKSGGLAGDKIDYRIDSCATHMTSLVMTTTTQKFARLVDSEPSTLKACREAPGATITGLARKSEDVFTAFPVSSLVGKKFCMPTRDGALYLALDASGTPAGGPSAITVTYAVY